MPRFQRSQLVNVLSRRSLALVAIILVFAACIALPSIAGVGAQSPDSDRVMAYIVGMEGSVAMKRADWYAARPVYPGTAIQATDRFYLGLDAQTLLTVLCVNGVIRLYYAGGLAQGDVILCDEAQPLTVGSRGTLHMLTQRSPWRSSVPYVLAPRGTAIAAAQVTVRWQAIDGAHYYSVIVRGGAQPIESGRLRPANVVTHKVGSWEITERLEEGVPYTAAICVEYSDGRQKRCTDGPEWDTPAPPFYVVPAPERETRAAAVASAPDLAADPASVLLAQALIWAETAPQLPSSEAVGYNQTSLELLDALLAAYPDSAAAQSPAVWNLRGKLYLEMGLYDAAHTAFVQGVVLAEDGTEAAAEAAWGVALTQIPDGVAISETPPTYEVVREHYAVFLDGEALQQRLSLLCGQASALCPPVGATQTGD